MQRRLQFDFKRAGYVPLGLTILLFAIVCLRFESAHEPSRQTDWLATFLLFSGIFVALIVMVLLQATVRQRMERLDQLYHGANRELAMRNLERAQLIAKIESLQARKNGLKQDISYRDIFISVATHELKTPLTTLKLQLQLTKRRNDSRSMQMLRAMDICLMQTRRLEFLVDDLLDVSNIRASRVRYHFERVDLVQLAECTMGRLQDQLGLAGIKTKLIAPPSAWVTCDRLRMEQVLTNLLTNAAKYGSGQPVEITIDSDHENAWMSVRDFGVGIPTDKFEKIFEAYERCTENTGIRGLGLGLFIAKQIVNAHKGQISVASQVGEETLFTVQFPANLLM